MCTNSSGSLHEPLGGAAITLPQLQLEKRTARNISQEDGGAAVPPSRSPYSDRPHENPAGAPRHTALPSLKEMSRPPTHMQQCSSSSCDYLSYIPVHFANFLGNVVLETDQAPRELNVSKVNHTEITLTAEGLLQARATG